MKNNLIKIIDPKKAELLSSLGFNYVEEKCGDKCLYTFFSSEELMSYIVKNFDKRDFLLSNKMTF